MSEQSSYFVRSAQIPQERALVTSLWRGNLGESSRAESKFDWFYAGSVTGTPQTLILMHRDRAEEAGNEGEAVGVGSAAPRSFLLGGQPIEAAVLVDLAVTVAHRTLYPALLLQKSLLSAGLAVRRLLYAFPNQKAAAVFQRAGYRRIGLMTRFVRVLRSRSYLEELLPAWVAASAAVFVDVAIRLRYAHLGSWPALRWQHVRDATLTDAASSDDSGLVRGARTAELLRWRFADHGRHHFHFVTARRRSDGAAIGYWVVEALENSLYVRDCSIDLLRRPGAVLAWTALCAEARRKGFRSLHFECLAPPALQKHLRALGMKSRSQRPVFAAISADIAERAASASWFLTAADEDE